LHTRANPGKIADLWEEVYLNPKIKFRQVGRFEKLIPQVVNNPKKSEDDLSHSVTIKGDVYDECYFAEYIWAKKILNVKDAFRRETSNKVETHKISSARQSILSALA